MAGDGSLRVDDGLRQSLMADDGPRWLWRPLRDESICGKLPKPHVQWHPVNNSA